VDLRKRILRRAIVPRQSDSIRPFAIRSTRHESVMPEFIRKHRPVQYAD